EYHDDDECDAYAHRPGRGPGRHLGDGAGVTLTEANLTAPAASSVREPHHRVSGSARLRAIEPVDGARAQPSGGAVDGGEPHGRTARLGGNPQAPYDMGTNRVIAYARRIHSRSPRSRPRRQGIMEFLSWILAIHR